MWTAMELACRMLLHQLQTEWSLLPSSLLPRQLRVIRAFQSMLEDMQEKRSVNSLHSFHSLRISRSHHSAQTFQDDLGVNHESHFLQAILTSNSLTPGHSGSAPSHSTQYYSSSASNTNHNLYLKSQSYENVPLVSKHRITLSAPFNPSRKLPSPQKSKTLNEAEITQDTETSIWSLLHAPAYLIH